MQDDLGNEAGFKDVLRQIADQMLFPCEVKARWFDNQVGAVGEFQFYHLGGWAVWPGNDQFGDSGCQAIFIEGFLISNTDPKKKEKRGWHGWNEDFIALVNDHEFLRAYIKWVFTDKWGY